MASIDLKGFARLGNNQLNVSERLYETRPPGQPSGQRSCFQQSMRDFRVHGWQEPFLPGVWEIRGLSFSPIFPSEPWSLTRQITNQSRWTATRPRPRQAVPLQWGSSRYPCSSCCFPLFFDWDRTRTRQEFEVHAIPIVVYRGSNVHSWSNQISCNMVLGDKGRGSSRQL